MGVRTRVREALTAFLRRSGYEVLESSQVYEFQKAARTGPRYEASTLPDGAEAYLRPDHPRLAELRDRYAAFDPVVTTPFVWTEGHVRSEDLRYFRGDNAYVWQLRGAIWENMNILGYALATYYIKSIDTLGLLERLVEDDRFGNFTFQIDHKTVSRDLLDSIIEICFLERHLSLSSRTELSILDIGAGYGRLAHRVLDALPSVRSYLCTDAFAASTFVSEYYLRYRNLVPRGKVVPLDEIEGTLASQHVDLAINVHSFSECALPAIEWWLSRLEKSRIGHLMIVPNAVVEKGALMTNDRKDFQPIIERHGYRLIAKEPKYRDPIVQEFGMSPAYQYLFQLDR